MSNATPRQRMSRPKAEIEAEIRETRKVTRGRDGNEYVWVACHNCGGSGQYPSSMTPAGQCRFYCWRDRSPETFGKIATKMSSVVRSIQAQERRTAKLRHLEETRHERMVERAVIVRAQLKADPELAKALTVPAGITSDIARRLMRGKDLSEKQVALVKKIARENTERVAQRKADDEALVPAPEGRHAVTGVVLTTKIQRGMYGDQWKMLVKVTDERGVWKCWGSEPSCFQDVLRAERNELEEREADEFRAKADELIKAEKFDELDDLVTPSRHAVAGLKGRTVSFTAAFERSKDDESFAFFKRPTKATIEKE